MKTGKRTRKMASGFQTNKDEQEGGTRGRTKGGKVLSVEILQGTGGARLQLTNSVADGAVGPYSGPAHDKVGERDQDGVTEEEAVDGVLIRYWGDNRGQRVVAHEGVNGGTKDARPAPEKKVERGKMVRQIERDGRVVEPGQGGTALATEIRNQSD